MRAKTTISITEARKRIFDITNEVQKPGVYYTFTEKGRPKAVLLSAEEFEAWQETLGVMRDFPDLPKDIQQARTELARGKYITLVEVLEKEGLMVTDNTNKKYAVSRRRAAKGAKRAGKNR